jgi:FKBP-type peptidyl-prolyl cis-trans isomerase
LNRKIFMHNYRKLALVAALATTLAACDQAGQQAEAPAAEQAAAAALVLDTDLLKVSYGLGLQSAMQLSQSGLELDVDAYKTGFDDAMAGNQPQLSQEDMAAAQQAIVAEMQAKQQLEIEAASVKNAAEAEAFLTENAGKEGVVTTESGLQYKVISAGEGAIPAASDTVEVHYRGTLLDGTEFDSSYSRNQSVSFPVGGVIPGWTEALQLMPAGSKWELYIPADLAYGPGGTRGIPPNSTLIFEVELLSIEGQEAAAPEEAAADASEG